MLTFAKFSHKGLAVMKIKSIFVTSAVLVSLSLPSSIVIADPDLPPNTRANAIVANKDLIIGEKLHILDDEDMQFWHYDIEEFVEDTQDYYDYNGSPESHKSACKLERSYPVDWAYVAGTNCGTLGW